MPGQTISFEGDYNSLGRYVIFPFEILGNNFALDANFDNSFVEFTDLVLSTSNKQAQLPFQVYPNPAQQTISFDSEEPIYKVDLYTIEGKLVKSLQSMQAITQVDLPPLPNGLYTLRIRDREFQKFGIQKVMIQN